MNNKKGISLVVLVITIIVMIILASVALYVSSDTANNSKIVAFAMDLQQIEDLVDEYYLSNNDLPIKEGIEFTASGLSDLISYGISDEIAENKDTIEKFYQIDLDKLPVNSISRGNKEDGDETDIYVVARNSRNVYYLKGAKIAGEYYFSLSKKLIGKSKIEVNETEDTSNITITQTTGTIKLVKNINEWTNTLTVEVQTTTAEGESLKYYLAEQDITTLVVDNIINVSGILSADDTLKTTFYSNDANKEIKVEKYKNETIIAEETISVSNLDMLVGSSITQSNVTYTKNNNFILASIAGYTDLGGSGLKEARVLYTTKLDEEGNVVSYYDDLPSKITKEYVYASGIRNNATTLKIPTDVTGYSLVFVDNAGNISELYSFTIAN